MPDHGRAGRRFQLSSDDTHEGGLPFSVTAHQGHLLAALDFDVSSGEYSFLWICGSKAFRLVNHVAGARSRRELYRETHLVYFVYLYPFKFLQCLDAGLYLIGLGGLVTEGLDELFRLLDHALLVLVGGGLLRYSLCPEFQILGIWHLVIVDMPEHDLHRTIGHVVQKLAVVRHKQ